MERDIEVAQMRRGVKRGEVEPLHATQELILQVLGAMGPLSVRDLVRQLALYDSTVRYHVRRLARGGRVVEFSDLDGVRRVRLASGEAPHG